MGDRAQTGALQNVWVMETEQTGALQNVWVMETQQTGALQMEPHVLMAHAGLSYLYCGESYMRATQQTETEH
jgi:hypothetical protein